MSVSGYLQGPKFKAAIPEIKGFVRYHGNHVDIKNGTNITSQVGIFSSTFIFHILIPVVARQSESSIT